MKYPKIIFAVILSLYFLSIAYAPLFGSFLDMVDLPIHETGHLIFGIFGEFIGFAGGTLFQLIVPAVFIGYFVWQESYYSASIVVFWLGQSLLNVYVYASDAVNMVLQLVGGGIHDWNWMLTTLGMLDYTKPIAALFRIAGTLVVFAAVGASVYYALQTNDEEWEEI